jgi:hypothetical protein
MTKHKAKIIHNTLRMSNSPFKIQWFFLIDKRRRPPEAGLLAVQVQQHPLISSVNVLFLNSGRKTSRMSMPPSKNPAVFPD